MSKFNRMTADQIYGQYEKDLSKLEYWCAKIIPKAIKDGSSATKWHNPAGMEYRIFVKVFPETGEIQRLVTPIGGLEGRETFFAVSDYKYSAESRGMAHFTYHFMQRYMKRTMHQNIYSEDKVAMHYFEHNMTSVKLWQNEEETEFIWAVNTGICLCRRDIETNICHFCTYVSYDMMKGEQKEAYKVCQRILELDRMLCTGWFGDRNTEVWENINNQIEELADSLFLEAKDIIQKYKDEMQEDETVSE